MVFVSPELTVLIVLIFPLLIAVSMLFVKRLRALTKAQQAALAGSSRLAEEAFVGIKIVKAFNAEGDWIRQFSQSIEEVAKYGLKRTVVSSFFQSVVTALLNIILLSILVIALYLLSIARITSQDLVAFVMYGTIVTVSFSFLVGSFSELAQAAGAFERVSEFEALPSFKCGFPSQILTKEQPKELGQLTSVELQEISFSYPARVDLPVLTKINLKIRAGQTVALVGPSGSGKSAIAQLVMGFYQPSQGVVLINGQIANSAELLGAAPLKGCSSFYGEIGYVPQDALLFSGSIADNLRLGSHLIEDSQLWEACRLVNMADFISNLPSGLDTDLGQLGAHLSGGQRQRLAITRALVRRPRLLILDEATSGLDLENEAIVLSNLRSFQEDALILLISHRYSSVRSCDYVYVLSDGRMIEEGVASQLYGQDTVFRYLMSDS
jgi:ATP-binding cassette subfamily B protein